MEVCGRKMKIRRGGGPAETALIEWKHDCLIDRFDVRATLGLDASLIGVDDAAESRCRWVDAGGSAGREQRLDLCDRLLNYERYRGVLHAARHKRFESQQVRRAAAISSAPSGAPWTLCEPALLGAP